MQPVLEDLSMDSKAYGFTATSDLSEIRRHGIEGIVFGTGELSQAHKPNEYITLEEIKKGTKIFNQLLRKWDAK